MHVNIDMKPTIAHVRDHRVFILQI
jgi:hypothetical protein